MTKPHALAIDEIPWEQVNADGTRLCTVDGSRASGRVFTYALFLPAGFWDTPHSHSADARVFVLSGELWLGYGDALVRERARRHPAGSYLFVPAGAAHFDGAQVDTIIAGVAVGPRATTYVS